MQVATLNQFSSACFTLPAVLNRYCPVDAMQNSGFGSGADNWNLDIYIGNVFAKIRVLLSLNDLSSQGLLSPTAVMLSSPNLFLGYSSMVLSQIINFCPGAQ